MKKTFKAIVTIELTYEADENTTIGELQYEFQQQLQELAGSNDGIELLANADFTIMPT